MKARFISIISVTGLVVSTVLEYGLSVDFPLTPAVWLTIALVAAFATTTQATLQTNSWNTSSGLWDTSANWTSGRPALSNAIDIVAGGSTLPAVATINGTTLPGTMTISNLIVRRFNGIGAMKPPGTVSMDNAGTAIPLVIENSLTITIGGTVSVTNSSLTVAGNFSDDGNLLFFANNGGEIKALSTVTVGDAGAGQLTVYEGTLSANVTDTSASPGLIVGNATGSSGTLTLAGGTTLPSSALNSYSTYAMVVGNSAGSSGTVWLTGGQLITTNLYVDCCNCCDLHCFSNCFAGIEQTVIGAAGVGQMIVSNGTAVLGDLLLGHGTFTQAGGTTIISSEFDAGDPNSSVIWMTGGQLIATNTGLFVSAPPGPAQMTMSNGTFTGKAYVGLSDAATLTLAGGTFSASLFEAFAYVGTTAAVWITGGQLLTTTTLVDGLGGDGILTQSGGVWRASFVSVGGSDKGTVTISGGDAHVYSNLTLGFGSCFSTGIVNVTGGNLYVTNAAHNAVLDVRSGAFTQSGGLVKIDVLVMTNACGHFIHTGGTLSITTTNLASNLDADSDGIPNGYEQAHGLGPLDPTDANEDPDGDGFSNLQEYLAGTDPINSASVLRISAITPTNNDLRVTWQTAVGKTNALERTSGSAGSFSTNNFAAVFIVTNTVGTITNYLDVGAATNSPSLYYRVRLVP